MMRVEKRSLLLFPFSSLLPSSPGAVLPVRVI
jgi:hypothetical protein